MRVVFGAVLLSGLLAACTVVPASPEGTPNKGGTKPGQGTGDGSSGGPQPSQPQKPTFPSFTPGAPEVPNHGGHVFKNPVLVTITWPGMPHASDYEAFGDKLGQTAYWQQIVGEYGVGAATSGASNHVRLTQAIGNTLTDQNYPAYLTQLIQNGTVPAPTDQTLYVAYVPAGSAFANAGCQQEDGYHDDFAYNGTFVSYAVVLECPNQALSDFTLTASHEIGEASTDPWPTDSAAYQGLNDNLAWDLYMLFQDETADMCEFEDNFGGVEVQGFPYVVQRQWSNKAAAAGHDPCVPAIAPYFNVAVVDQPATVVADLTTFAQQAGGLEPGMSPTVTAPGFPLAVGETKKIKLGFYSDQATAAWSVDAIELDPNDPNATMRTPAANPSVDLALDKTSGKDGDTATLTVTLKSQTSQKTSLVLLVSTLNGIHHYMPLLVGGTAGAGAAAATTQNFARRKFASHAARSLAF